ncbi:Hypothetical protein NGK_1571 [Neisseria gonorrhoeae NCCP11945]|uniref:Uncharacterized protein n=1 Tax=Neisseria gonorrhoeae (strain NCCP11945) TaxID=521006 RepID=B4RN61_NEIG2|nr:Hypothetical protein NGK_1571 [Neisseria gonorrhoeae NCCP11945]
MPELSNCCPDESGDCRLRLISFRISCCCRKLRRTVLFSTIMRLTEAECFAPSNRSWMFQAPFLSRVRARSAPETTHFSTCIRSDHRFFQLNPILVSLTETATRPPSGSVMVRFFRMTVGRGRSLRRISASNEIFRWVWAMLCWRRLRMFSGVKVRYTEACSPIAAKSSIVSTATAYFRRYLWKTDNKSIARTICKTRHSITRLAKILFWAGRLLCQEEI